MRGLLRALLARCPVCGANGIWRSYGQMVDACPGCGYRFSREEGYWVGGLIINTAFTFIVFLIGFVGVMILTFPDVPWNVLLVGNLIAIGLTPVVLYRQSKTLWIWVDQHVHPYAEDERDWEAGQR